LSDPNFEAALPAGVEAGTPVVTTTDLAVAQKFAGIFEWGWPVGLKLGLAESGMHWGWIAFAGVCMVVNGALLLIAQKTVPMGTAYAVWTGIGAVGTFVLGLFLFSEPATLARFFFVEL
jgi:quaternary ammonium compound-resistance protein SugE